MPKKRTGKATNSDADKGDEGDGPASKKREVVASAPPKKNDADPKAEDDDDEGDAEDDGLLHCMRCHESYRPPGGGNNAGAACVIEHDLDSFEGSRNGTDWYTGRLGCCGASYRFHRHYSDDRADPPECHRGRHTTDPAEVVYNGMTVRVCASEKCGEANAAASAAAYEAQRGEEQRRRDARREERERHLRARVEESGPVGSAERRREERRARAVRLGLDFEEDELNSDVDEDGCEEFDGASDSSLVPPWAGDGDRDSGGDY